MKTALRSITKHGEAISLKIPTMRPLSKQDGTEEEEDAEAASDADATEV